jgi:NAD-dependent SIR2 family protein deacetylase
MEGAVDQGEGKAPGRPSDPYSTFESFRQTRRPPRCDCGGILKSATISFGQSLVPEDLDRATEAATEADLVVALGSSLSVYPAASIPLVAARRGRRRRLVYLPTISSNPLSVKACIVSVRTFPCDANFARHCRAFSSDSALRIRTPS